jgi:Mg2+-importing ATPase
MAADLRAYWAAEPAVLIAALGFLQEYRASRAVAALRSQLALRVRVVRDGCEQVVPAADVVPGDVVLLAAGNLVPGDGVVLEARDFLVVESSPTGESFPVEKRPGTVPESAPLTGRSNAVFLGTSVRSGTARVLLVRTGAGTELGAIAARLASAEPETAFARGIRQFGYLLLRVMLVLVVFVLVVNEWLDRPLLESLLFAMALAVGLSPELLPAIVSVTLSRGAREMARRGVIVARLEAIEDLGAMDVLCTDKTGTLTVGVLELEDAVGPDGRPDPGVLRLAALNARLETGIENPLDAAIVAAADRAAIDAAGITKVDEIPYDFIRKRLTIVVAEADAPGTHLVITKGAFAAVLSGCTHVARGGEVQPLDVGLRQQFEGLVRARGDEGCRVLALATRRVPARGRYGFADEAGLTLRGFLVFRDPPKPGAAAAIAALAAAGVRTKVITGDNRYVAAHLARAVGLDPAGMVTAPRSAPCVTRRSGNVPRRPISSSRSIRSRRRASSVPCSSAGTPWATSATASTTRRRCAPPMSASRCQAPSTWPARVRTWCCSGRTWTCCAWGLPMADARSRTR